MTKTPQSPGTFWLYYFNVDAIDAAAARDRGRTAARSSTGRWRCRAGNGSSRRSIPQGAFFALVAPKR